MFTLNDPIAAFKFKSRSWVEKLRISIYPVKVDCISLHCNTSIHNQKMKSSPALCYTLLNIVQLKKSITFWNLNIVYLRIFIINNNTIIYYFKDVTL